MKRNHLSLGAGVLCPVRPAGSASAQAAAPTSLSQNRPVTASPEGGPGHVVQYAVDGSTSTRWASVRDSDPQWIYVDLGADMAPTTPVNPHSTGTTSDSVSLAWDASDASTDNVGGSVRHLRDDRPEGPVAGDAGLAERHHLRRRLLVRRRAPRPAALAGAGQRHAPQARPWCVRQQRQPAGRLGQGPPGRPEVTPPT